MTTNKHSIFVYGTLKKGGSNHGLMKGSTLINDTSIIEGYNIYNLGGFPGVNKDAEGHGLVIGQLYEIDDAILARLDRLEGTNPDNLEDPSNLFHRVRVNVDYVNTKEMYTTVEAWMYLYSRDLRKVCGEPIEDGIWHPFHVHF